MKKIIFGFLVIFMVTNLIASEPKNKINIKSALIINQSSSKEIIRKQPQKTGLDAIKDEGSEILKPCSCFICCVSALLYPINCLQSCCEGKLCNKK